MDISIILVKALPTSSINYFLHLGLLVPILTQTFLVKHALLNLNNQHLY